MLREMKVKYRWRAKRNVIVLLVQYVVDINLVSFSEFKIAHKDEKKFNLIMCT